MTTKIIFSFKPVIFAGVNKQSKIIEIYGRFINIYSSIKTKI